MFVAKIQIYFTRHLASAVTSTLGTLSCGNVKNLFKTAVTQVWLRKPFLKTGLAKNGKSKNVLFLAEKRIGRTKFAKKKKNSDKHSAFNVFCVACVFSHIDK